MVFFGEYHVSFTGNGRLVLPKKIRELLKGDVFILSKGYDQCLTGYDKEEWEQRAQSVLGASSLLEQENISKKRFLFASTTYVEIDDQGRFVIPKGLLEFAHLAELKAVIVGVGDHFEIWDEKKWELYLKTVKA